MTARDCKALRIAASGAKAAVSSERAIAIWRQIVVQAPARATWERIARAEVNSTEPEAAATSALAMSARVVAAVAAADSMSAAALRRAKFPTAATRAWATAASVVAAEAAREAAGAEA